MDDQNIGIKKFFLFGGVIIAVTVIAITIIYPDYFKTVLLDEEKKVVKLDINNEKNKNTVKMSNVLPQEEDNNNYQVQDHKKEMEQLNIEKEAMSNHYKRNISSIGLKGPPPSTLHKGEEGNHDFPIKFPVTKTRVTGKLCPESDKFDIATTMATGEEGNPMSGPTTMSLGEEGNPAFPPHTSNVKGEESTEHYGVRDMKHSYANAGLGLY